MTLVQRVRARRAHSAVEFTIAAVILGVALVPMFGIFKSGRTAAVKSKISYLALHVARERLEELRQIPFDQLDPANSPLQQADFEPVKGNVFQWTTKGRNDPVGGLYGVLYHGLEKAEYEYPAEYDRIFTKVTIADMERKQYRSGPSPDTVVEAGPGCQPVNMRKVTLEYFWQEHGEALEEAKRNMRNYNTLMTIVAAHGPARSPVYR